jgi:hypothetical protein
MISREANAPPGRSRGRVAGVIGLAGAAVAAVGLWLGIGLAGDRHEPTGPADPFAGTAAQTFPAGEDGLVLPAATPVPGFTVEEVAEALATVRAALIAGRLDERMLYDHDRTALDALFSEAGRELLDAQFGNDAGTLVATRIAPGHRLTDDAIRVTGGASFDADVVVGVPVLVVRTNYVWVYPFAGALARPGDHLVTIHDTIDWVFPAPDEVTAEWVGMFVGESSEFVLSGMDCALAAEDLVALGTRLDLDGNAGDPDAAFDPDAPLDVPDALRC